MILAIGPQYALSVPTSERPILLVLGLYLVACALYFFALSKAITLRSSRGLTAWVLITSAVFRLILLFSPPFQEIDIYRYLWDGAVVAMGEDPYAFPPEAVVTGLEGAGAPEEPRLAKLVDHARSNPALEEIVRTIHYGHLPSPYPPVSQAVFFAAAATSPDSWSADARLRWLKAFLVLCDLITLLLVVDLLRMTSMPVGWAVAYGWCPLVMKEIAGSGHLDAIATLLTVAACSAALRGFGKTPRSLSWSIIASVLLGLGVGAKLFPVVLAPLLAAGILKRHGWRATVMGAAAFLLTCLITLAPMLLIKTSPAEVKDTELAKGAAESLPPPPDIDADQSTGKTAGLAAFLKQWEMNDLIFMVLLENLQWQPERSASPAPWFDLTPNHWSEPLREQHTKVFLITRGLTLLALLAIALLVAWRSTRRLGERARGARDWLNAAFLTLAWFWLLAPTQNPWYWCWAAPLLPFARRRAWLAVSCVGFAYYLRFWLEEHFPEPGLLGTPYDGQYFFYYVVPWLEFLPIFIWLLIEHRRRGAAL